MRWKEIEREMRTKELGRKETEKGVRKVTEEGGREKEEEEKRQSFTE